MVVIDEQITKVTFDISCMVFLHSYRFYMYLCISDNAAGGDANVGGDNANADENIADNNIADGNNEGGFHLVLSESEDDDDDDDGEEEEEEEDDDNDDTAVISFSESGDSDDMEDVLFV
jgi:hypothetical protein